MARARCSALFTDATVVSSKVATSAADQRSTSHKINTARCLGGRCCRAATKASRTELRRTACSAGSATGWISRSDGIGWTKADSTRGEPSEAITGAEGDGDMSTGSARRLRDSSASRQTLVAILYSQDRIDERPSKLVSPFQARTRTSWTASSASTADPSIR